MNMPKAIIRFVRFVTFSIISIFALVFVFLLIVYIHNLNKDNFVNRNQLKDITSVEYFLEASLPSSQSTSVDDIIDFVEAQGIACDLKHYQESNHNFSGRISCTTPVTNPEFYGAKGLLNKLLATLWDSITADPPQLYIDFIVARNSLQQIEVVFVRLPV